MTKQSENLKVCPFCGGEADEPDYEPDYSSGNDLAPWKFLHRCTDRWRGSVEFAGETKEEAIKAWNTRPAEPLPEDSILTDEERLVFIRRIGMDICQRYQTNITTVIDIVKEITTSKAYAALSAPADVNDMNVVDIPKAVDVEGLGEALEYSVISRTTLGNGESYPTINLTGGHSGHAVSLLEAAKRYYELTEGSDER